MMSRKIYVQELEQEARCKAREARLAFATAAGESKDDDGVPKDLNKPTAFNDELMELVEQGKEIIGKFWVVTVFLRLQSRTDAQC